MPTTARKYFKAVIVLYIDVCKGILVAAMEYMLAHAKKY